MKLSYPPLSLYVHIPWCVQKCPYCDFNSHQLKHDIPEQDYVRHLLLDLDQMLPYVQQRPLQSIFFGGGTPSLFSATAIMQIIQGVKQRCQLTDEVEITLEANPGTVETERFSGYIEAGVNRLSIGVQSLDQVHLQRLGRIHDPNQALVAIDLAKKLPLRSFNVDLMHGLGEQTVQEAELDLHTIIAQQVPHISWYQLTIEPNTLYASKPPRLPTENILYDIQDQGELLLTQAHYQQYEISAFTQPGHQCQHNLNYWRFGDYIGIGCGAHSKVTTDNGLLRSEKIKHPQGYLQADDHTYRQWQVAIHELSFEFFMNHLRLKEAIPKQRFIELTGLPLTTIERPIAQAISQQLLEEDATVWRVTTLGHRFLNSLLQLFL